MVDAKNVVEDMLKTAGITINGKRDFDIQVHNDLFYQRVLAQGVLGLGEAYMDGWWDVKRLDLFGEQLVRTQLNHKRTLPIILLHLKSKFLNMQTIAKSQKDIVRIYDLGSDLYTLFLDPLMQYTCGYFKGTKDLAKAQEKKLDLICKKLQFKEGERVLDIGCGWGGFAKFATTNYGVHVTGVTISKEQARFAREFTKELNVTILEKDYRDVRGDKFDKIVVVGMIEHVGYKNHRIFFRSVEELLEDEGLFLLHTIGSNKSSKSIDPWTEKYIFPGGMAPSIKQIGKASEGIFVMEDWHSWGPYYYETLMAWAKNFENNWDKIKEDYDERFYRMWNFYLLGSAASFKGRNMQLWQIVFSKGHSDKVYESIR